MGFRWTAGSDGRVFYGRSVFQDAGAAEMPRQGETAAEDVAAECCRRISAQAHRAGNYRHAVNPAGGRVCCFGPKESPPPGWEPSKAQAAYDAQREG